MDGALLCCCLGEMVFDSPRTLDGDLRDGDLRGGDLRAGELRVARREAFSSTGAARVVRRLSMFVPSQYYEGPARFDPQRANENELKIDTRGTEEHISR